MTNDKMEEKEDQTSQKLWKFLWQKQRHFSIWILLVQQMNASVVG